MKTIGIFILMLTLFSSAGLAQDKFDPQEVAKLIDALRSGDQIRAMIDLEKIGPERQRPRLF